MAEARVVESPALSAVRDVLEDGPFLLGAALGKWGVAGDPVATWPAVDFWVAVAPRSGAPARFGLRLDLDGYPRLGPTGSFWDLEADCWLEPPRWPKGTGRVRQVFRSDWQGGRMLYHPLDRGSADASGHPVSWPGKYPASAWHAKRTLVDYLEMVHELLHSEGYRGV